MVEEHNALAGNRRKKLCAGEGARLSRLNPPAAIPAALFLHTTGMPAIADDIGRMGFAFAIGAAVAAARLGMTLAARVGAFFEFIGGHGWFPQALDSRAR